MGHNSGTNLSKRSLTFKMSTHAMDHLGHNLVYKMFSNQTLKCRLIRNVEVWKTPVKSLTVGQRDVCLHWLERNWSQGWQILTCWSSLLLLLSIYLFNVSPLFNQEKTLLRLKVPFAKQSKTRQAAKRDNPNGITQLKTHADKKEKSFTSLIRLENTGAGRGVSLRNLVWFKGVS